MFTRVACSNILQYVLTIVLTHFNEFTSMNSLDCDANKSSEFCEDFWQSEKKLERERNSDGNVR